MFQGNLGHAGTAPKVGVSSGLGVFASVLWIHYDVSLVHRSARQSDRTQPLA